MARYVIDAPTLLRLVEQGTPVHSDHQLVAPSTLRSQALVLLLRAVRRGDLTDQAALEQHDRLTELKVRLLGDRVSRLTAWRVAREQGWESLEDAEYVAVARLQADALVTVDPALEERCRDLVPLAAFDALLGSDAG